MISCCLEELAVGWKTYDVDRVDVGHVGSNKQTMIYRGPCKKLSLGSDVTRQEGSGEYIRDEEAARVGGPFASPIMWPCVVSPRSNLHMC